ncbi:DUF6497 family protein [Pacificibacter marinus]|uniref:DUF6497 family protein n=1 Tax=Pacificibacter marinus TaxID=658057 RepID=UPI001C074AB9|nr:DUF6497 family protein [Pacificibacter marinus]MBU2868862.1 acetolactate synthase [Pacificibacter marinus]
MKVALFFTLSLSVASAAHADLSPRELDVITVPSGQPVTFFESMLDRPATGLTARFRFVAPELPQTLAALSYDELEADMAYLCDTYAMPRIAAPVPSMIVISLSERETVFGSVEQDVAQVFEAYRPAGTVCEWEAF